MMQARLKYIRLVYDYVFKLDGISLALGMQQTHAHLPVYHAALARDNFDHNAG
jgi:hypothetical protein